MTLEEIFKDKPELLEEPCVKALVEHVKSQHQHTCNMALRYQRHYYNILDICLNSDVIVIKGKPSKEAIQEILELED